MKTRIIAGGIGFVVAAFIIQTGGIVFSLFCLFLMLLGYFEYARALKNIDVDVVLLPAFLALALMWGASLFAGAVGLVAAATVCGLLLLATAVFRFGIVSSHAALLSLAGVFYVGMTLPCLIFIRNAGVGLVDTPFGRMEMGCALVWLTFIGTWASDTFAYFAGYFYGRRKLCPNVSPKKTVEGFIGGVIGTMLSVAFVGSLFGFNFFLLLILGFILSPVAALGDLVESVIKRYAQIKDSGSLIPGHGGVLDRFDSVIFTAPVVYYFLVFVLGA